MTIPLPLAGGCQCGACRYAVTARPLTIYACHCTECARQSGGSFGMSMPVRRGDFTVTRGAPATWSRAAASGRVVDCAFCPACGVRLYHLPRRNPDVVNVKPGTLDDTRWVRPVGHLWLRSAAPGFVQPAGMLRYAAQPADFEDLLAAFEAGYL